MKTAELLIKQAQSWIGLKESDKSYLPILDAYNTLKPLPRGHKMNTSDDWCAAFVTACAVKTGMTDIIPPECSCNQMIALFQKLGCWQEDESVTPAPGWIIFYDWDASGSGDNKGRADHVGIVEVVSGNDVTVIEGNYSNSVKRRYIKVNDKRLRGYGVPKFQTIPEEYIAKHQRVTEYTVVKGDTPEKIAKRFVLTPQELIAANIGKYPKMTIDYIQIGWVLDIPEKKVEAEPVNPVDSFKVTRVKVTTENGLNVRTGPSSSNAKLGALYFGETVTVLGLSVDGKWGKISYKSKGDVKTGWICLAYTKEV